MVSGSCEPPGKELDRGEMDHRDRGGETGLEVLGQPPVAAEPGEGSLHSRPYDVAKECFEWSAVIERDDLRGPVPGRNDRVEGQLSRHRTPDLGAVADGGAHGPAQGSSLGGAGILRDHPARSAMPDRRLHPPGTDPAQGAAESRARPPAAG